MNQKSYELLPHPDGGVFAVWQTPSGLYAGWRVLEKQYTSGTFYGPPARDVRLYGELRHQTFQIPDLSLYPMRIYPEFRHAPLWVRKAAFLTRIHSGVVQIYESGYTYIPERLRAIVFQASGVKLLLYSEDEDRIWRRTWNEVRNMHVTVGKQRNIRFLNWN